MFKVDNYYYVLESSANLNNNKKEEFFIFNENENDYNFYLDYIKEYFHSSKEIEKVEKKSYNVYDNINDVDNLQALIY